jgi:hypothetical protein
MENAFRFLFSLIAAALLLTEPVAVMAQDEAGLENTVTGFENVQLWIYAEYDDPYQIGSPLLLVMLEGQIVGAELPAEVRFLVPVESIMYSAGSKDAHGIYTGGPPDREASGIPGWDVIWYEVTSDTFRVEYYDPSIILGEKNKAISYQGRWLFPISDLVAYVQAPSGASNFKVAPAGVSHSDQGYDFFSYQFANLDDDSLLTFEISYSTGDTNPLLITGIIIAVLAVFITAYFWIKRPSQITRAERRRNLEHSHQVPRFCRQCGHRLEQPSKFCPDCGASLK